jgi:Flp pilus assembly protein TadG
MFGSFSRPSSARVPFIRNLRRFLKDQQASLSTAFFLSLLPILVGAGAAVDYGSAVGVRTAMLSIADSASIAAARTLHAEYNKAFAATGNDATSWTTAQRAATTEANTLLSGNKFQKGEVTYNSTFTFSRTGAGMKARVVVDATTKPLFAQFVGMKSLSMSVASEAETSVSPTGGPPLYADVYLLLDRTGSMLVGESPQDVANTRARIFRDGQPCAFACHENATSPTDPYNSIKALGGGSNPPVRLKFDVALEAIAKFASTAKTEFHRIAVYGITDDWGKASVPLVSLSNNMSSVASAVRGIRPEVTGNYHETEISYSMMQFFNGVLANLPASGDGSSSSKRKIIVVLITDGVESIHHGTDWQSQDTGSPKWPWAHGRVTGAPYMMGYWSMSGTQIQRHNNSGFRESVCKLTKDKVDLAVLEVEYPDITGLDNAMKYEQLVKNWQGRISGALKNCASPSLYFKAGSTRGAIDAAADALFKSVTTSKRAMVQLVK